MSETYVDAGRQGRMAPISPGDLPDPVLLVGCRECAELVLAFAFGGSATEVQEPSSLGRFQGYLVINAAFPVFLASIALTVILIRQRGLRTVLTYRDSIDKKVGFPR